ncbi:MAG TPA: hypothetical protein VH916_09535, partial [Dehalococcoidia bacterium]
RYRLNHRVAAELQLDIAAARLAARRRQPALVGVQPPDLAVAALMLIAVSLRAQRTFCTT